MSRLRVRLLGHITVTDGDEEPNLGPPRQRAVLAVLAARAGQAVTRSELIEAVWGPVAPPSASSAIYLYISNLRKVLGKDVLASVDSGYALLLRPDQVDVSAFDRLTAKAARQPAAAAAAATLTEALSLWSGEPLAGIPGPFAAQERTRLTESWLRAVEASAKARIELGDHGDLVADLGVLAREHPLRESLRELLMQVLARGGRHADALEVFRDARDTLRRELGIEPGPGLRQVHAQILAGDDRAAVPLSVMPAHIAAVIRSDKRVYVGRAAEVAKVRDSVAEVLAGRGGMVWIEGDPGIGKSELLIEALADLTPGVCQLGWAVADEPDIRFPLRLIMECLGITVKSPDADRADLAAQLRAHPGGDDDPITGAVDRMLALVDRMCAHGPVVLVIDDLQWADEASVHVWRRLSAATRQLPLLLVTCSRTGHGRAELDQLRSRGRLIAVEPLPSNDVESLTSRLVGAHPGKLLRRVTDRAAGNPLYLREMVTSLVRDEAIDLVDGVAHIDKAHAEAAPRSLADAVERTCGALPQRTHEVLRWMAVLGPEATMDNVVALTGRAEPDLRAALADAVDANVVFGEGARLVFRHPLMREAILGGISPAVRLALHRAAAKALAATGAQAIRVAEQLASASAPGVEEWVPGWLAEHVTEVANHAPLIAADLLERVLEAMDAADPAREVLLATRVKVLFRLTRVTADQIEQALAASTDPVRTEELRQLLAAIIYRDGRRADSIRVLTESDVDGSLPSAWRQRRKFLLAHLVRDVTDVDAAETMARNAYDQAVAEGETGLMAHALQTRWIVESVRRDHVAALGHIEAAIDVVRGAADLAGMHFNLLDNRLFTLQNLDRMADADENLRAANELVVEHRLPVGPQVAAAVHYYWAGRWDEALYELDTITEDGPAITYAGLMDAGPAGLLLHGVSALIAGRRDDHTALAANLDAAERYLVITDSERESQDFLLAARALAAVRRGDVPGALAEFAPVLDPAYAEMMLRHQWLPEIVRLSLEHDSAQVDEAIAIAELEASRERVPARAYAALHRCKALATNDPEPALVAVDHYRTVGRPVELAVALEDAAVLLAARNAHKDATTAYAEAVRLYVELGAHWDRTRAKTRMSEFGIREPMHAVPGAGISDWETLSAAERQIAAMVANGLSNPEIATRMSLPRRIVQAHVVQIMAKLGVDTRAQIQMAS
ncbi:hypothetical protein ALI144C_50705 [Actinosynnema sp. ALI-1.44]|uniref:BTAD domain-containing putative transcriptional regulator n=1 Tax=Actinosynnema sp. ALI-1.44 TaxID=1933779 RepID=UPI00097C4394|nr:BTAD domain-containing putative transcriptional regulator [Actinosynnema sp. ALI-1.44]ONI70868.1 hypothetical protein ALI144C_50705 [Actinosynnema sp. ALI-1.44]